MRRIVLLLFFYGYCIGAAYGQDAKYTPRFSVIFDSANGYKLLKQCSRCTPDKIEGFWTPTTADVDSLRANFKNAYTVVSGNCCAAGGRLFDSLNKYGIQYTGLIINGKKFIYGNAFLYASIQYRDRLPGIEKIDLKKDAWIVCDGGLGYWGILYNIQTKEFSALSFNCIG